MPRASILGNFSKLVTATALSATLGTAIAEARGVGVGHQSPPQETAYVGRGATSPTPSQPMPPQADGEIVAERTQIKMPASEAASLLDDLRLQLAAQPGALLNIRWQLTRPAQAK
ncbi:MAG: hypothetical protein L0Y50_07985 [Beijerinckiaceae bacterium]|nr:hypothetical protein [Beijerinckiaceae bacterium]